MTLKHHMYIYTYIVTYVTAIARFYSHFSCNVYIRIYNGIIIYINCLKDACICLLR